MLDHHILHFLQYYCYCDSQHKLKVKTTSGSFSAKMSSSDATALSSDPKAKEAFAKAFAQTIGGGLAADEVLSRLVARQHEKRMSMLYESVNYFSATSTMQKTGVGNTQATVQHRLH